MHHLEIAALFNRTFAVSERTVMIGGASEPLYRAPRASALAEIHYREDFAASALHEAAHWCIAGAARRRLDDFGYWYIPPPRSAGAQERFFAHERRVQALESIFADAAGVRFCASADDPEVATDTFAAAIAEERFRLLAELPKRPAGRASRLLARLHAAAMVADHDEYAARRTVGG